MGWFRSSNKYRAKQAEYNGQRFDSGAEAAYAAELDIRVRTRDIRGYRRQVTVPLDIRDSLGKLHHICSMRVDFVLTHNDGSEEYQEFKGFETREWAIKAKLFRALYPDRIYTVVKR